MRREYERMMRLRFFSILSCIALIIVLIAIVAMSVIITTGDYSGVNSDFAEIEDTGSLKTKEYNLGKFENVYLFSENYGKQRTLFTNKIPHLKIVNSDKYQVDIKASKSLLEKLDIKIIENSLVVTFDNKYYADVVREGRTYRGLFVECEGFEVTVYAPVTLLTTDAEITLDYQAPKTNTLITRINGEVREGRIYDIDCDYLNVAFCGMSNVTLEGIAHNRADIVARHNSKIEAQGLKCSNVSASVTCQLFGFSYVNYRLSQENGNGSVEYRDMRESSFTESGFVVTIFVIMLSVLFAALFIIFRVKFFKQKKAIDEYIEKAKSEEKYLKIPEKKEENVLQNEK